jgi:hypothetical protein
LAFEHDICFSKIYVFSQNLGNKYLLKLAETGRIHRFSHKKTMYCKVAL